MPEKSAFFVAKISSLVYADVHLPTLLMSLQDVSLVLLRKACRRKSGPLPHPFEVSFSALLRIGRHTSYLSLLRKNHLLKLRIIYVVPRVRFHPYTSQYF